MSLMALHFTEDKHTGLTRGRIKMTHLNCGVKCVFNTDDNNHLIDVTFIIHPAGKHHWLVTADV